MVQNQTYIDRNKFEEFKFTFDSCLNEVILYELHVFRFITGEIYFIKALNLTFLLVIDIRLLYSIKNSILKTKPEVEKRTDRINWTQSGCSNAGSYVRCF